MNLETAAIIANFAQLNGIAPSGEVRSSEGAALAVKRTMLDYHKKHSPLEKGQAKGRGETGQWLIAVLHRR